MEFKRTHDGLSEEALSALEKSFGFVFPATYRQFLSTFNGGVPINDFLETAFGEVCVKYFYGSNTPDLPVDLEWSNSLFLGRVSQEFFVIGCDPGGNQLLMHKDPPHEIYWWDHEQESSHKIADGFQQLLDSLTTSS